QIAATFRPKISPCPLFQRGVEVVPEKFPLRNKGEAHSRYSTTSCPKIHNRIQSSFRVTPAKAGGRPGIQEFQRVWIPACAGMTAKTWMTYLANFGSRMLARSSIIGEQAEPR